MQDPIAIVPPEKIGKNKFVVWNNATRPYHRPATTDLITAPVGNIPTNNSNKSRPEKSLGTSFDEAANLYFEEQIELLFNIEDT